MSDEQPDAAPGSRPRNAAATRAAILDAARIAFTHAGYERVGVREIAAAAGVNAALIIRYFGSKEGLFAAAVQGNFAGVGPLLEGDRAAFGERTARYLFRKRQGPDALDPLLLMLRSVANDQTAAPLCAALHAEFVRPFAAWLGGEDAPVRAALIAAYLAGLSVLRDVLHETALTTAPEETFVALVAPVLQAYADGVPVASR